MTLGDAFAGPEAKRRYVRRLFGTIADRYDLITVLLSFGSDRRWKRRLIELSGLQPGWRVLDLACGTGDLALAASARGGAVVGLDITPRMIELARAKPAASPVRFIVGDMTAIPVPSGSFDLVTTGYGLRNVPDLSRALAEIERVLVPGGTFCSLDFNRPEGRAVRAVYLAYLTVVGSALGFVLHRDPDTYRYIPASIRRYPGAAGVSDLMRRSGLVDVRAIPVLGGLMTIHLGRKVYHRVESANERSEVSPRERSGDSGAPASERVGGPRGRSPPE
jgi:demethylmenaquinone methyltransferase/2-methoxy-6-polyprenyl-1,4-benzoquinol methylase